MYCPSLKDNVRLCHMDVTLYMEILLFEMFSNSLFGYALRYAVSSLETNQERLLCSVVPVR